MGMNGNRWEANGKAVGKFKRYVLPFVGNGNSMVNHWENLNGVFLPFVIIGRSMEYDWKYSNVIYNDSSFTGVQWHITKNTLVVLISIQY